MILTPVVRLAAALTAIGLVALLLTAVLLRKNVAQLRADRGLLAHQATIARQFERTLKDVRETEGERAALRAIRPKPENLVRFVEGLEAAAARTFVDQTIKAIAPAADQSGQPYTLPVVRYHLILQGTGEKVEAYLRELQRLPELARVERLDLKAPPDGHVVTNATAELVLAVAIQKTP